MILHLLTLYGLLFLVATGCLFVLRRSGSRHNHLRTMLLSLAATSLLGGVLAVWQPSGTPIYLFLLQLVNWALFLWAWVIPWRVVGPLLLALAFFAYWPGLPGWELLAWGLVTAVPLTLYVSLHRPTSPAIPIVARSKKTAYQQPAIITGDASPQATQAQQPILECLVDGIVFSGVDGVITYVNQAAATIIGREVVDLLGYPVTDILTHLPMLAAASTVAENALAAPRQTADRFEINGRIIQGRMTIIYSAAGVAQGTVAILRDITTEYHAERSRDNFLTTVSHELRTPLTAVKGYTELLDGGAGGPLTDMQKALTKPIQRNVTRMVQLINSLLFAAAVKGGQMAFTSDHTNIPQLVNQISRELMPKAAASGQRLIVDLDERLGVVQADPMHMATILEELLTNAIKYNKPGGEVHIHAVLQSDEAQQQEFMILSIRDEGIGIQPEDQAHLFEEFFHPEKEDIHIQAGGIGMGLSVVRSLLEAYNGRIWLESVPAQGSTFFFLLPVRQEDAAAMW